MSKPDLSILIPARNEEFLQRTIDNVLANARGNTEVLVALDNWEDAPAIITRGNVIYTKAGQRGATNELAKLSEAKYLMKLDAHVSMSPGFDVAMMKDMEDNTTLVPAIANLHAYDWVCPQGHRHFQGKYEKCEQCGSTELTKDIKWQIIPKPIRSNFYFDTNLHFQYMSEDLPGLLTETMSIQGSCFMVTREKYFELNICDEAFGSWGQQGVEVALKTWLSGGRVLATKKAFYGHQFRETEGFPWAQSQEAKEQFVKQVKTTQNHSKELFCKNKWPLQKRSFQSVIEQFNYPGDWSKEKLEELCEPLK